MNYEIFSELLKSHLDQYCEVERKQRPKELYDPELYILSLGGKRLRPLLTLIGCDLFNKEVKTSLDAALTVELFHNFSLIHDDILDQAPLRRNSPTVHQKWNTNSAILSGDLLLVQAYEMLANYKTKELKQLLTLFNRTAIEVCEGQQLDMNFERSDSVTVKEYIEMIRKKTAVLLGCSLQMGAICAGAGKSSQKKLYEFGVHLGLAFQLNDDLLDVYADKNSFGKQTGGDIVSNKRTFLLIKALEKTKGTKRKELNKWLTGTDHSNEEKVTAVKGIYDSLGLKELCIEEARKHTLKAISNLEKVKADPIKKESLKKYALHLLERSN